MDDDGGVVALRSADAALIEHVRSVVMLADVPLAIHPPAAAVPRAALLLDSATEVSAGDPEWVDVTRRSAWVSAVPGAHAPDGGACLVLPGAAEEVLAHTRTSTRRRVATVIGVVGARGGAGASSLAAVLARAAAAAGLGTALVDLDIGGPGLEMLLSIEHEGGLRWADVAGDRGTFDEDTLSMALPSWRGVHVLSVDDRGGPPPAARVHVLDAMTAAHQVVVVDLPRPGGDPPTPADLCDLVVVVAGCDVVSAAGAQAVARSLGGHDLRLVVRGPAPGGLSPAEMARTCGLPLLLSMRPERSLAAAVERGVAPGEQRRGPLLRAGRRLVHELGLAD